MPPLGHPDRRPPRQWVIDVAHGWFGGFRRLLTRAEERARHDLGFSPVAAVLIIYRKVRDARVLDG